MRSVSRNIAEERAVLILLYKFHGLREPDISAKPLMLLPHSISHESVVKIVIGPVIQRIANSSTATHQYIFKTAILGAERIVVTQMPLAEKTSAVSACFEDVGHCDFSLFHARCLADCAPNTGAHRVTPRHQHSAGGCASGHDVKVRETHTLSGQVVHVQGLDEAVAVGNASPRILGHL